MRLRFSVRDLLWLTLVAALCMGWWVSGIRKNADLQAEKDAIKARAIEYAEMLKKEYEKPRKPRFQPLVQG